jgi:hypothetical protein
VQFEKLIGLVEEKEEEEDDDEEFPISSPD